MCPNSHTAPSQRNGSNATARFIPETAAKKTLSYLRASTDLMYMLVGAR